MSQEEIQDQPEYFSLDKQIHQINGNQHQKQSDYQSKNEGDEEDSPFQQLQQILGPENNQITEKMPFQTNKSQQLQNKCKILQKQNLLLLKRIEELQMQIYCQNQAQEDTQKIAQFIQLMQSQISTYKTQFEQYKQKHIQKIKVKEQLISKFKDTIAELNEQKYSLQQECSSLLQNNNELEKVNQSLIDQIQTISRQLKKSRYQTQSTRSYKYGNKRYPEFDGQVQIELERLIEKLVSQLQFERGQKRRLSQEIKRMQQNIMELQRQITFKNNKIYTLQIKYLQQNKEYTKNQKNKSERLQDRTLKYSKSTSQLNDRNNGNMREPLTLKTFSIKELINQIIQVNERQKFVISSKVVDFYLKKLKTKNYSTFMLQDLLICNFTKDNPNLTIIKNDLAALPPNGELSAQKLINNLVFVIQSLLGQILNAKQQKSQNEEQLIYLVNEILQENSSNMQDIYDLKKLIDAIITEGKQ